MREEGHGPPGCWVWGLPFGTGGRTALFFLSLAFATQVLAQESGAVSVWVTGDITGRLAQLSCQEKSFFSHNGLSSLAQELQQAQVAQLHAPERIPILVDNGSLLGTDGFARFILGQGKVEAQKLGRLVAATGYDVVAPGMRELAADPGVFDAYLKGLVTGGARVVSANLSCGERGIDACGLIRPYAVVVRGGVRIGVTAVVDDGILGRLPPGREGLWKVSPQVGSARSVIARLRGEEKVDVVVLLSHVETAKTPPRRTLELARKVAGWDVLVGNGFYGQGRAGEAIEAVEVSGRAGPILGTGKYSTSFTELIAQWDVASTLPALTVRSTVRRLPGAASQPRIQSQLSRWAQAYCKSMDVSVSGSQFFSPWTQDDLRIYAMNVMRNQTRSEVALLNRDHLRLGDNKLEGSVSYDLLFRAFPFYTSVGTFFMRGYALDRLIRMETGLTGQGRDNQLDVLGVTRGSKSVKGQRQLLVNGRNLEANALYRVVTTQFLAEGGDGHLAPREDFKVFRPLPTQRAVSVRQLIVSFLEGGKSGAVLRKDSFPDLKDKALWQFNADFHGALDTVRVVGAEKYADAVGSQLTRSQFSGQSFAGAGVAILGSSVFSWQNRLELKYGKSRAEDETPTESADLIRVNSVFGLKRWAFQGSSRLPAPYVEADIESEFTPGNPYQLVPADYRHLMLTGIAGLRSRVVPRMDLFLGAGVRAEALEPGGRGRFGIQAGYRVLPYQIGQPGRQQMTLESGFEYFRSDPAGDNPVDRIIWSTKIYTRVFKYLTAGLALDAFAYREASLGQWATSGQAMVTLGMAWSGRVQTF